MARKPTRAPAKRKQPAAVETSQSIEDQTREFLKSGNKIDVIQSGISVVVMSNGDSASPGKIAEALLDGALDNKGGK